MNKQQRSHYNCIYDLSYRLVLVTKNRENCFTDDMLARLKDIVINLCEKWDVELVSFDGKADHIDLLLKMHPNVMPSKLINNFKTVTSRLIRRDFKEHLSQFYSKPVLWARAYCLLTTDSVTSDIIKQYIEDQ